MILSYGRIEKEWSLRENEVLTLQIESSEVMNDFIHNLWEQSNGETGNLMLYENAKEMIFSKNAEIVLNPYLLDCNNRKIQGKLFQEVGKFAQEEMQEQTGCLNRALVEYMDYLIGRVPYQLEYNAALDINALLKCVELRMLEDSGNVAEKVISYIKIMHQMCGTKIFFFWHLKDFLTRDELSEVFLASFYEKVNIILIESSDSVKTESEKIFIIDKDLCIIEV